MTRTIPARRLAQLTMRADPQCPACLGEGYVSWDAGGGDYDDVACDCALTEDEKVDTRSGDGDAWSGGFADNH